MALFQNGTPKSPRAEVLPSERDLDIQELQKQYDALYGNINDLKQQRREVKQTAENTKVVLKEFDRSLQEKKSKFDKVKLELDEIKAQLEKKQKEYDASLREVNVIQEVVDTKSQEITSLTQNSDTLKKQITNERSSLKSVKEKLDSFQAQEWETLLSSIQKNLDTQGSVPVQEAAQLKNLVQSSILSAYGIPDICRGRAWQVLCDVNRYKLKNGGKKYDQIYYHFLEMTSKHEKTIEKDIYRSFPSEEFRIRMMEKDRTKSLFNVLKAYSLWDDDLAYCQGMNFVVSMLLLYMDQESAFWVLCILMHQFKMVGLYQQGKVLPMFLDLFDNELSIHFPTLHTHLTQQNVSPVMYLTEWLTTMYVYNLSLDCTALVWDLFFWGGGQQALIKVGLAIFKLIHDTLIKLPMEDIMLKMKKQVHALTPHDIVSAYQTIILSQDTIQALKQIEVHWIPKSDGTRSLTVFLRQISDTIATEEYPVFELTPQ